MFGLSVSQYYYELVKYNLVLGILVVAVVVTHVFKPPSTVLWQKVVI